MPGIETMCDAASLSASETGEAWYCRDADHTGGRKAWFGPFPTKLAAVKWGEGVQQLTAPLPIMEEDVSSDPVDVFDKVRAFLAFLREHSARQSTRVRVGGAMRCFNAPPPASAGVRASPQACPQSGCRHCD